LGCNIKITPDARRGNVVNPLSQTIPLHTNASPQLQNNTCIVPHPHQLIEVKKSANHVHDCPSNPWERRTKAGQDDALPWHNHFAIGTAAHGINHGTGYLGAGAGAERSGAGVFFVGRIMLETSLSHTRAHDGTDHSGVGELLLHAPPNRHQGEFAGAVV
jgi:hypothetical protein